ncbi:GNAT family N-acetyltransferase [Luteimonas aestuarii]|uniref:GNAT family N-acetyltransferase n=1 Tax=Luteimonas aestuarii TaxID=453837 RepID=A0A4R5TLP4_9GAMM|nr:GNAT family N-acetyltransferase [Luteimonas aestuarii]TDK22497.1 GNAT family N-acetyltransferase [Luteimonas aestuarii]
MFRIRSADHAADFSALRSVREVVFVEEQQVPREIELDALDAQSRHVIAEDAEGRPIGTGRLTPERKIGRMAVLRGWRGRGVGAAMLHALLRQARGAGWESVCLHAQANAVAFYRRHGFAAVGERFMEAGIEHQAMRLRLDRPVAIEDREAAVALTVALVQDARRRLVIRSRELDPGLLDDGQVLEALRTFGTTGRGNEVHVLLHDAAAAQRAHAPLLVLAQRLPSVFALREVDDPVDRNDASACIASDAGGYYHRPLGQRFDGEAALAGAPRARQLLEAFDPVWQRSRPCSELRALGL